MPSSETITDTSNKIRKSFQKPSEHAWVTSGKLGTRDAVLVFRTSLLNEEMEELESTSMPTTSLCQNLSSHNVQIPGISSLCENSSPENNVLSPLPRNANAGKPPSCNIGLRVAPTLQEFMKLQKAQMDKSLSSSDASISSGIDDLIDIEYHENIDVVKKESIHLQDIEYHENIDEVKKESIDLQDIEYHENIDEVKKESMHLPAEKLKITFKFNNTETRLLRRIFTRHGLTEVEGDENFNILWTGAHMKPDMLRNLTPYQRVNHFPRSYELTRKDRLYKNIEKMQHLKGFKHFDIVPQSFVLPLEYRDLISAHNKYRGPWIVKPTASSRGRGIFIVNSHLFYI